MVTGGLLFLWGAIGAFLAEIVNGRALYERNRRKWNIEKKRLAFYAWSLLFVAAGGAVAFAHESGGAKLTMWLAMNVGFTWPLLLRRGIGASPEAKYDVD